METAFSSNSVIVAGKDRVSCPLGDDVIILDLKAGLYFSLDNVGAVIWQLIQEPRTVGELRQAVLDTFEVDAEVCERDLLALLRELATRNLIEVRDGATA
jgi:Coenzyme PQQ synthesis protein D (PqqD)